MLKEVKLTYDVLFARIGATGNIDFYLTDRLGSVRDVMDHVGTVIDHVDYNGFGKITSETNPGYGDRYKFTGRELDDEIAMQFNRGRYYQVDVGRWNSEDQMRWKGGDPNLYRYVTNSPTNATDPSGTFIIETLVVGGAVLSVLGIGSMGVAAQNYEARDRIMATTPLDQWTPQVQADFDRLTWWADTLATGGEIAGEAGVALVAAPVFGHFLGATPFLSGAASAGIADFGLQSAYIGAGIQNEYNVTRLAAATALGGTIDVAARALARPLGSAWGWFRQRVGRGPVGNTASATFDTIPPGRRLIPRPVEIEFPTQGLTSAEQQAFAAHLFEQELRLNQLSLSAASDLKLNLLNYANIKPQLEAARALARQYLPGSAEGLHAAHHLDAVAGGYLHDFIGFRDPIQSRIGALWKARAQLIEPGKLHRLVPRFGE